MFTTRKNQDSLKVIDSTPSNGVDFLSPIESTPSKTTSNSYMNHASESKSTFFSEDAELKGSLSFSNKMEFNGRFEGELIADGPLVIGEKAMIRGDVIASSSVIIYGKIKGNISAKERVELKDQGQLYGDVKSPKLLVADGAIFVGRSDTLDSSKPAADFGNMFNRLAKGGDKAHKVEQPA